MSDSGMTLKRWFRRQKNLYCRRYKKSSLLTVALLVGMLYLIHRFALSSSPKYTDFFVDPHHKNLPARNRMTDSDISRYKRSLRDTRSEMCQSKNYPNHKEMVKASFLLYYRDQDFNLLKLALSTLVEFTPKAALYEVIIIDDGTSDTAVQKDEKLFLAKPQFEGINILTFKSKVKSNYAASWVKAAKVATGDILVFIDSDAIFNTGWYEPLVDFLVQKPDAVAVPHSDAMLPDARFVALTANYVNVFSWRLSILHYDVGGDLETDTRPTPVFRGDLFAMQKHLYESLGELDAGFASGEGSELEFSIRTWLCGGEIHIIPCSGIAVHNVLSPREIELPVTFDRIVKLWFDTYDSIVYRQTNQQPSLTEEDSKLLKLRKNMVNRAVGKTCKSFDWYLSNVAQMVKIPSIHWTAFGKIRDSTGHCLKLSQNTESVDIVLCNPPLYQPDLLFEYTSAKHLTVSDWCLTATTDGQLTVTACTDENIAQKWIFYADGRISSKAFDSCIEHSTKSSPDGLNIQHQAVLKPCDDTSNTQKWSFLRY